MPSYLNKQGRQIVIDRFRRGEHHAHTRGDHKTRRDTIGDQVLARSKNTRRRTPTPTSQHRSHGDPLLQGSQEHLL